MGESSLWVILLCWSMLYFNWTANHTLRHLYTHTCSFHEWSNDDLLPFYALQQQYYMVPKRQSSCQCWTSFRDTMLPRTHHCIRVTIQAVIGFDLKTQALGHVGCFILAMLLLVGSWSCTVGRPVQTLPANGNHRQHTRKNPTNKKGKKRSMKIGRYCAKWNFWVLGS